MRNCVLYHEHSMFIEPWIKSVGYEICGFIYKAVQLTGHGSLHSAPPHVVQYLSVCQWVQIWYQALPKSGMIKRTKKIELVQYNLHISICCFSYCHVQVGLYTKLSWTINSFRECITHHGIIAENSFLVTDKQVVYHKSSNVVSYLHAKCMNHATSI